MTCFEEAELLALQGACHSPEEALSWKDGGIYDLDGELFHRVRRAVKVESVHRDVIRQYF